MQSSKKIYLSGWTQRVKTENNKIIETSAIIATAKYNIIGIKIYYLLNIN